MSHARCRNGAFCAILAVALGACAIPRANAAVTNTMDAGTASNLTLAADETAWFALAVSSGTVYTLDLLATNHVAANLRDGGGAPLGKALSAYGLTFTATNDTEYLVEVVNGALPGSCRFAAWTNALPFYRVVTNAAERPWFMTNQWYDGSEFGYVHVHASRVTNDAHSYRLPVVQLASGPDATNGAMIYLSGGPGSSAINQPYVFRAFTNTVRVIAVNQRGTYLSQPGLFPISDAETTEELQARLGGPGGMDFNTINTRENAADVHDVMTVLGNPTFNVWGTSYGTMLSQEVIRQHPERIRAAVLDGVVKLDEPQWTIMGQGFYDAVIALTNDVARDPDANRWYPAFGDTLMDFAAELYPDDYHDFFDGAFHQMNLSRWGRVEDVPGLVWRAANGELAAMAGLMAVNPPIENPPPDGPMSGNMYAMMIRHDMLPFESMTNAAALTNSIPFPLNMHGYAYSQDQYDGSEDWDFITAVDASFRTAVTNDVPVLVLNGNYDTQTPPRGAKHVATNLPHAYYVELPYIGHVVLFGGDVPAQIGRDFMENPGVFPDTNGIAGMSLTFTPPWPTNAEVLAVGATETNDWEWNGYGAVGEWYKFAATAGEDYVLEVGSPDASFAVSVVTTNAEITAQGAGPSLSRSCAGTGDYYAWLVGETSGTFTVSLTVITNELIEGESAPGELAAGHTAWFHCSTVSGQYYGVVVTGATADVSVQLVNESLGFITNRAGGWTGWTSLDDGGYDVGLSSTGDTPFVVRFYSFTSTIAVTRSVVTGYMARFSIPGVSVALVDGDGIAWIEHFGFADVEEAVPVDGDTVFMIGSLSKTLTTLTALQLFDEDALDLDASVTNYIPEFSLLPRFAGFPTNITTRNMLDHHSGLPGDIYNGAVSPIDDYWPGYTTWLIEYFAGTYALYPPDTFASYCNSGFNIVAEIVARLDGTNFPAAAENRLFGPLGMTYSSFIPDKTTIAENLATGYDGGQPSPDLVMNMPATGGAYSRAEDIARVMIMLAGDGAGLWTTNALAEMDRTPALPLDVGSYSQCGLGLDSVRDAALSYGGRTWAKNGSTGFFESFMEVLPDRRLGCIVLMNTSPSATYGIARAALKAAMEEKAGLVKPAIPPMDFTPTNRPQADLLPFEGLYVTRSGLERFVAETNGTLTGTLIGLAGDTVSTGYQALVNGRFAVPGHTNLQCAFTNIAGEDVIVRHGNDDGIVSEMILDGFGVMLHGSRFVPPAVPAAWSNRVGAVWVVENLFARDLFVLEDGAMSYELHLSNGVLRIGGTVLEPADDDTAYVAGLVTRGDGAVRILHTNGQERLQFNGYRCMRVADIPELAPGVPLSGTNLFHEGDWYVMNLGTGTYTLTCDDANVAMLFYADLGEAPVVASGEHTFAMNAPGAVYVALVTMSASAPYELDAGRAELFVDRAAALPDGLVLRWVSQPGSNYTVEVSTNLMDEPAFAPLATGIPSVPGVWTSWTSPAPSAPAACYRVVEGQ